MLNIILNFLALVVVPLTFVSGFYFSFRLKWLQLTKFATSIKLVCTFSRSRGALTSFVALASVLGGNLGVGNIAGVAIALKTGGPGSIFWMWVMAILASSLKFVSCYLGRLYRVFSPTIGFVGGPMYYIQYGLKSPWLAKIFCVATILAALTVGNMVQINSIIVTWDEWNPFILVFVIVLFLGFIFKGNLKRFSQVSAFIVPSMAICYIGACCLVLFNYSSNIMSALRLIIESAFTPYAIFSGGITFSILQAIQVGFNRGLFATDAGAGLEAIIHSSVTGSERKNQKLIAYEQALISTMAPIFVVALCTLTALVLMVTGTWINSASLSSAMCVEAFQVGLNWTNADLFLSGIIFFFGVTTIITWSFCCERAIEFLFKKTNSLGKILCLLAVPFGAFISVDTVWKLGDISFNIMLLINLISILILSHQILPNNKFWLVFKNKQAKNQEVVL